MKKALELIGWKKVATFSLMAMIAISTLSPVHGQKPTDDVKGVGESPVAAEREVRIQSTSAAPGAQVTVNVRVDAIGDESEYGFVVLYNQTVLSSPTIGAGSPGGAAIRDCNTATAGVINCSVGAFPTNNPGSAVSGIGEIPSGNNQILITVTFNVAAGAAAGVYPVTFRQTGANSPPNASNDAGQGLTIKSTNGNVTIAAAGSRQLRVESTNGTAGQPVTVNIRVDAVGDESEYGFAILYEQAILSNPVIGPVIPNGAQIRDCNIATAGVINCSVGAFPNNNPGSGNAGIGEIPAGNNQILIAITFNVAANALSGVTPVTFRQTGSNSPPNASNDAAQLLGLTSVDGTVTIAAARQVRIESTTGSAGNPVTVNVRVDAVGDESEYGLVVLYDQSIISGPVIGAGGPGGAAIRDCNTATAGVISCSIGAFPNNNPGSSNAGIGEIPAGNNQVLITITFNIAGGAPSNTVTPVTFRQMGLNSPPNTSNDAAATLPIDSLNGTVTILGPTSANVSVAGRATSGDGRAISGAVVTLTDGSGVTRNARTNPFGYYRIEGVPSGASYALAANHKSYRFTTRLIAVEDDVADADLAGEQP